MEAILELIVILVLGFLSAHVIFGKLRTRLFFVTGIEFLVLGFLCGPNVLNVMTEEVVVQLSPVATLAIGALGVLYGLQIRRREWTQFDVDDFRISLVDVLFTCLLVGGSVGAVLWFALGWRDDPNSVLLTAAALGSTAAVSAPTAIDAMMRRFNCAGPVTGLLQFLISFGQFFGIVLFGLIFCIFREGRTQGIEITRTEWVAISLGFGLVLGLLFYLFLGSEASRHRLLLALTGIVIFSSGVAYHLQLSPLAINLFLGMVLGITTGTRAKLLEILLSYRHPLYVLVLIFAGAAWRPGSGQPAAVFAGLLLLYISLRSSAKYLGGAVAQRTSPRRDILPVKLGAGLVPHGAVAVAMAVNFQQVYPEGTSSIVMSCVLASVIFSELVGQRLARNLLVDAGEIPLESGPSGAGEEGAGQST